MESVQDRYRRLFEDSPHGIFVTDQTRRLLDCNQALRALLGYGESEDLGDLDLVQDFFYSPADYQKFQDLSNLEGEFGKIKIKLKHRDGSSRHGFNERLMWFRGGRNNLSLTPTWI